MHAPSSFAAAGLPAAGAFSAASDGLPDNDPHARFYAEHPTLAGQVPHHNDRNGASVLALKVTCDACDCLLPLGILHGVINDYTQCTEIRYVGHCPQCHQTAHNVLRVTGEEVRFIREGKWCVATRRPWWTRLWPWPVDCEWS